jgi:hypothetical protein
MSEKIQTTPDRLNAESAAVDEAANPLDAVAVRLYNLASMLLGEGEEAVTLVERTLASPLVSGCCDAALMERSGRNVLASEGVRILAGNNPASLAAPTGLEPLTNCIEDDDLAAAGVSATDLEKMLTGPGREKLQRWLAGLPAAQRSIFALRALGGYCANDTAKLLVTNGGPQAAGWTQQGVRETMRKALCSLASQLIRG